MSEHLPVLIVILPLTAALVVPLVGRRSPAAAHGLTLGAFGREPPRDPGANAASAAGNQRAFALKSSH